MKTFKTLDAAFNHQTHCPFCQTPISMGYTSMSEIDGETTVEFNLYSSQVTIEYYGDKVLQWSHGSDFTEITTRGNPVFASNGSAQSLARSGKEIFRVICRCGECQRYTYILQVHMDMDEKRVVGVVLNSESFSIEKEKRLHEIRNIYVTDKTEYKVFDNENSGETEKLILPLIPMDYQNPDKTLERIKTLALFS